MKNFSVATVNGYYRKRRNLTPEEYLALEEKAESKSEYVDGYIFQMAGGTEAHNDITFSRILYESENTNQNKQHCRNYFDSPFDLLGVYFHLG